MPETGISIIDGLFPPPRGAAEISARGEESGCREGGRKGVSGQKELDFSARSC